MKKIATSPELRETFRKAADKSIVSIAVAFGGNIAAVASVDKALGFVTKLQNFTNVNRYGRWGLPPKIRKSESTDSCYIGDKVKNSVIGFLLH